MHRILLFIGLCLSLFASFPSLAGEREDFSRPEDSPLKISSDIALLPQAAQSQYEDIWQRIRAGLTLEDGGNPLIKVHEQWFAARPAHLAQAIQRSRPYLFHIVEEVEKRGMPMEIALLPLIESAFNPKAESPARAAGIWQFIPSTGRVYGLEQNTWYDGRRDIIQGTQAALNYLGDLKRMFGKWDLALAAYNCGEGCVSRAIARNRSAGLPTDYSSLGLPTETRHYVPKLLAARNAILDPSRFKLALDAVPNEPYFMQVTLSYPMEARTAARLADMSLDEFYSLNPAFRRSIIHSDSQNTLLLPADRIETFHFNLQRNGKDKVALKTYPARKGESLDSIAKRFDVTVQWLREHNAPSLYKGKLANSQTLLVPRGEVKTAISTNQTKSMLAAASPDAKPKTAAQAPRAHVIGKGDTLSSIARRYDVNVNELKKLNASLGKILRPGEKIALPALGG